MKYFRLTKLEFLLIFLAIVPTLVSFFVDFNSDKPDWFNRSGSIMVLFGAWLESIQIRPDMRLGGNGIIIIKSKIDYLAFALIILGTIIWGYGDLIF